ncbi:hypothetical protein [Mesorhizobium sp. B2-3-4]|uniref:hypothetical protein n=1 Tax=Mesorhizobium sp. B2-3-4 TaxID=2589959 RepID=UPI00112E0930|nr:hypothetical protein [Mesorhizobium sp. B2-3-4]TPM41528.1 hypothetical protein FJ967_00925 [Mesorhizobium sp. B2-3-4]
MITGRIVERFRERVSEWFCAGYLFIWGASLLHPSAAFSAPGYAFFRKFGENDVGWTLAGIGLLWLLGLIVNGSRQKATSTIRLCCGVVGSVTFGLFGMGFVGSYYITGILSAGLGLNFLLSLLALYCLYWIAVDKRTNG